MLRVRLFRRFCALRDKELSALDGARVQELFAHRLLNRGRPYLRESLADLLWGEGGELQTRLYLLRRRRITRIPPSYQSQAATHATPLRARPKLPR